MFHPDSKNTIEGILANLLLINCEFIHLWLKQWIISFHPDCKNIIEGILDNLLLINCEFISFVARVHPDSIEGAQSFVAKAMDYIILSGYTIGSTEMLCSGN